MELVILSRVEIVVVGQPQKVRGQGMEPGRILIDWQSIISDADS
jgi:hypothetical protein